MSVQRAQKKAIAALHQQRAGGLLLGKVGQVNGGGGLPHAYLPGECECC